MSPVDEKVAVGDDEGALGRKEKGNADGIELFANGTVANGLKQLGNTPMMRAGTTATQQ